MISELLGELYITALDRQLGRHSIGRRSNASPFLLFLSAQLTLSCEECTEIRCFYFDLKGNVMSHELIT